MQTKTTLSAEKKKWILFSYLLKKATKEMFNQKIEKLSILSGEQAAVRTD